MLGFLMLARMAGRKRDGDNQRMMTAEVELGAANGCAALAIVTHIEA
jgi:hypothetical protein